MYSVERCFLQLKEPILLLSKIHLRLKERGIADCILAAFQSHHCMIYICTYINSVNVLTDQYTYKEKSKWGTKKRIRYVASKTDKKKKLRCGRLNFLLLYVLLSMCHTRESYRHGNKWKPPVSCMYI